MLREDNRDRLGRPSSRFHLSGSGSEDNVNAQLNELSSEFKCLVSPLGPSIVNGDVLSLGIA